MMIGKKWTKTLPNRWVAEHGEVLEGYHFAESILGAPVGTVVEAVPPFTPEPKRAWTRAEVEAYAASFPVGSDMRAAFQKILAMPEAE